MRGCCVRVASIAGSRQLVAYLVASVCAELRPAPSGERPALEVPYLAPRDDGEAMLVGLWEGRSATHGML